MSVERNPYEAPKAPLTDTPRPRGRPVLVWVIVIFQALGIVSGLYSTIAALLGQPVGGEAVRPYIQHLTMLDHAIALIVTAISAFATLSLFQLKRRALYLLAAVLLLGVINTGVSLATRPADRAALEQAGYWTFVLGWVINLAIILYVWRLHAKGTLRA